MSFSPTSFDFMAQIETHDIGILIAFYERKDNQIQERVRKMCNL